VDLSGNGTEKDPVRSLIAWELANFNAAATQVGVILETDIVVKLRRLTISYDTADAPATGASVHPVVTIRSTNVNGTLSSAVFPLGEELTVNDTTQDSLIWDFGEHGLTLYRAGVDSTAHWDGNITVQAAGYASTDDMHFYLEFDWWSL
jgi:hypothetical protein